ncbi:MAG: helix-turn-helix transcriptional regulator [Thermoguttaceae bacterium]
MPALCREQDDSSPATVDPSREMLPLLLSVDQVGKLLSLSVRSVWRLVSIGELAAPVRIGRASRWKRDWVLAVVDALEPGGQIDMPERPKAVERDET